MAEQTNEELMDAWHEHRRRQLGEIAENGTLHAQSPTHDKPVDPQTGKPRDEKGNFINYASALEMFFAKMCCVE